MADFSGATAAVTGLAAIGLSSHADPGVVIAAFAGSVVFVLSAKEYSRRALAALFVVSWIAGVICSELVAAVLTHLLPGAITANDAVGALVAAAVVVRVLMLVDTETLKRWIGKRRGGSNAD
ncbi:hypothetical protein ABN36_18230 [Salmonella enterica subsp. enterica]|uniref:putative holin n=1 Tax=Salmonella enterica TaxID=28901 RepID=UPI0009AFC30C|nr:putative holin [Salmonella enterica]EBZ0015915.1 hypothetical protein [Salmonella enterica subsp. enterica serovar Suberu]ECH9540601.1 hypothetical protein [Salmonella enterica subsp. enterica]ECM8230942.1 hypothetical protein [Salmonella enterica subsp. enterica serovar Kentucky]EGI6509418.1 hypothetical protein [Salmonella enterica subsp. enterica serovar Durham]EHW9667333.1 hypothetical protein [Salmonella enterica subsp. enterica serovar Agbeni]